MIKLFRYQNELGENKFGAEGTDKDFICDVCGKPLEEGYVCKKLGAICMDCQKEMDKPGTDGKTIKWKCMLFGENEHAHTKFKRVKEDGK